MAEAIFILFDKHNADPVKDRRGCWKRGYCIEGHDDGWDWGGIANNGGYKILKMPGVPWADIEEKLMAYQMDSVNPEETYRRRRWKLDLTKLTAKLESDLKKTNIADSIRIAALEAILIDQAV